jgi:adenosylmethionine-8-amino-7-oxononanoate aminotransferase
MTKRPDLGTDQAHLMHPLHHPSAYAATRIWVSGQGAIITDSTGREYIDGLSGLWNVNIGHGRQEWRRGAADGHLAFTGLRRRAKRQ